MMDYSKTITAMTTAMNQIGLTARRAADAVFVFSKALDKYENKLYAEYEKDKPWYWKMLPRVYRYSRMYGVTRIKSIWRSVRWK